MHIFADKSPAARLPSAPTEYKIEISTKNWSSDHLLTLVSVWYHVLWYMPRMHHKTSIYYRCSFAAKSLTTRLPSAPAEYRIEISIKNWSSDYLLHSYQTNMAPIYDSLSNHDIEYWWWAMCHRSMKNTEMCVPVTEMCVPVTNKRP